MVQCKLFPSSTSAYSLMVQIENHAFDIGDQLSAHHGFDQKKDCDMRTILSCLRRHISSVDEIRLMIQPDER